ncbi:hypothetical protein GA0061105_113121 [Rhizobium aethiopicum]|uniref:Uncharacterized protein n=1 Tax=Rhizobium aethiopicum TaxID=1138170 RepID=A0A1C3Y8T7_9HYPH|nr:hypothetical protein GA0061105_113121 [Rhizobium aethiopicum]
MQIARKCAAPATEPLADMIQRDEYSNVIGAKSVCRRAAQVGRT